MQLVGLHMRLGLSACDVGLTGTWRGTLMLSQTFDAVNMCGLHWFGDLCVYEIYLCLFACSIVLCLQCVLIMSVSVTSLFQETVMSVKRMMVGVSGFGLGGGLGSL